MGVHTLPPPTIALVEASWRRVAPRVRMAAIAFDDEIVEVAPSLLDVFPRGDSRHRSTELHLVSFVVENLREPRLPSILEHMGGRGVLRGMRSFEIEAIGRVLLMVLRQFDDRFDADTRHAWATVFVWTVSALRRGSAFVKLAG